MEILRVLEAVRIEATTSQHPTGRVLANNYSNVPRTVAAHLPSKSSVKRTVQRLRDRVQAASANSLDRNFPIPAPFLYLDEQGQTLFLLHDSGLGDNRILIFSTAGNLHLLSTSQEWFADGTFSTVPAIFQQLYTIHAVVFGNVVPLVYCLLPQKNQDTYSRMFEA